MGTFENRVRSLAVNAKPAPFEPPATIAHSSHAAEKATSILGPDISIFGEHLLLKTKGSLLIQGSIEGNVQGAAVTVDGGASVKGTITAHTIEVRGAVTGALKGSNVHLDARSKVDASVVHQILSVAEGAYFEGSVKRAKDASEVSPDLG